jgi:hypothetical protein
MPNLPTGKVRIFNKKRLYFSKKGRFFGEAFFCWRTFGAVISNNRTVVPKKLPGSG